MTQNAVNPTTLEIVESAYEPTADGKGMMLKCLAQEVGGPNEGRLAHLDFMLENEDEKKQERGQRDFAGLRRATGVLELDDSSELHFQPFRVMIVMREDTGANIIRKYLWDGEPLAA